jgi:hypothetical protein
MSSTSHRKITNYLFENMVHRISLFSVLSSMISRTTCFPKSNEQTTKHQGPDPLHHYSRIPARCMHSTTNPFSSSNFTENFFLCDGSLLAIHSCRTSCHVATVKRRLMISLWKYILLSAFFPSLFLFPWKKNHIIIGNYTSRVRWR